MGKKAESKKKRLEVRMFHDFSLSYGGKPILFSRSSNTKFIPLLAMLFLSQGYAAPKKELLDNLYGTGTVANRNKSLNSVIYRLNAWLAKRGLPEGNGVVIQNRMISWKGNLPVWVDIVEFEKKMELAQKAPKEKTELLEEAEAAYEGEILGEFSTELWVITKNMEYKRLYEDTAEELKKRFYEQGEYLKAADVCKRAASLYPFESWQMREIDCLQAASEYDLALRVYRETAKLYFDELGLNPGQNMLQRLRILEERQQSQDKSLDRIGAKLLEDPAGAIYVSYPGFLDICRYCVKNMDRGSRGHALMLVTLEKKRQGRYQDRGKVLGRMDRLRDALCSALCVNDVFAKSSENQFLLLIEGREDAGVDVFDRLLKHWKEKSGNSSELSYSVLSLEELRAGRRYERPLEAANAPGTGQE